MAKISQKDFLLMVVRHALAHVNRDMAPGGGNTLNQCQWLSKRLRLAKRILLKKGTRV